MRKGPRRVRPLALVWLLADMLVQAARRFVPWTDSGPEAGTLMMAATMSVPSLFVQAPGGPSGLLTAEGPGDWNGAGRPGGSGVSLCVLIMAASVFAGLLGPVAIAAFALLADGPDRAACWRIASCA